MEPMRHILRLAVLVVAVLLVARAARTFSTFWPVGGEVHEQISRPVLVEEKGLSEDSYGRINESNKLQDGGDIVSGEFGGGGYQTSTSHFDDMTLVASRDLVLQRHQAIVEAARRAAFNLHDQHDALNRFGIVLHAVQDFYSHSNWLELQLHGRLRGAGAAVVPKDVYDLDLIDWVNGFPPARLKTGYVYFSSYASDETLSYRETCIQGLWKQHRGTRFKTGELWLDYFDPGRGSFKPDRLDRLKQGASADDPFISPTLCPQGMAVRNAVDGYSELHYYLCKDSKSSKQGKVRWGNFTLFEYAKALAVRETRRQWEQIEEDLRKTMPQGADLAIAALKGTHVVPIADTGSIRARHTEPLPQETSWRLVKLVGPPGPATLTLFLKGDGRVNVRIYRGTRKNGAETGSLGPPQHAVAELASEVSIALGEVGANDVIYVVAMPTDARQALSLRVEAEAPALSACAHPQVQALVKSGVSFLAMTLEGEERDLQANKLYRFLPSKLYLFRQKACKATLVLGFDGHSVRILLDGQDAGEGAGRKLVVVASYPSARQWEQPEVFDNPLTGKKETREYEADDWKNLRINYGTAPGEEFVAKILPSNTRQCDEGVTRKQHELTGTLTILRAGPGGLDCQFSAPCYYEFRDSERKELQLLANLGMEGCVHIARENLELAPDGASLEAMQDAARFKAASEAFRARSEGWARKNAEVMRALSKIRDPRQMVGQTKKLEAMQKEAAALKVEGQRIGQMGKDLEARMRQRAARVWELLREPVVIRP